MIEELERRKMLAVPLCGPRVIARQESIGVRRLADLRHRDPHEVMTVINLEAGRPIWRPPIATLALSNLIDAAAAEAVRAFGVPPVGRQAPTATGARRR